MDELVRLALEHEVVVEAEIERHRHSVGRGDSPPLSPTALDEHLVGLELVTGHAEVAVRGRLPVRPDGARRELPEVQVQPLADDGRTHDLELELNGHNARKWRRKDATSSSTAISPPTNG